ncbi:Tat pathway signal protein [Williamsia phyllosphaerae]|uniref:Tat pathway signal protein n=2 Tax=Williamsia phyllosphaerae TaxID=885042 RepID=A0ABQ1V5L8_9NOCA|nr:Tat pathway signal protein [Williamsia phyllosphaerae]
MLVRTVAVTGGVAATGTVLAACGGDAGISESTRIAEQLAPLSLAASDDAVAARTLRARNPDRAAALAVIATERETHATTINDEIARLAPDLARPSTSSGVAAPSAQPSGAPPTSGAPAAPTVTTVEQLRERLASTASSTGDLAVSMSGYRAGMLGSIAAACNAQVQVQLG